MLTNMVLSGRYRRSRPDPSSRQQQHESDVGRSGHLDIEKEAHNSHNDDQIREKEAHNSHNEEQIREILTRYYPDIITPQIWARLLKLSNRLPPKSHLTQHIRNHLLEKKKYSEACDVINVLNLEHEFEASEIIEPLVATGRFDVVRRYANVHSFVRHQTIIELSKKGKNKLAVRWIQQWKLNPNHYKHVYLKHKIATCKWMIREGKAKEFMEIICAQNDLRIPFISLLLKKGDIETAREVAKAYYLENEFNFQKSKLPSKDTGSSSVSPESLSSLPQKHLFLDIRAPRGVFFVDTKSKLDLSLKEIMQSDCVGLDAEYMPTFFDSMDTKGCNNNMAPTLLQISTRERTFLFDLLKFDVNMDSVLRELFQSRKVLKIGYAFDDDLSLLRKNVSSSATCFNDLINFLELKRIEKDFQKNDTAHKRGVIEKITEDDSSKSADVEASSHVRRKSSQEDRKSAKRKKKKKKKSLKGKHNHQSGGPLGLSKLCELVLGKPLSKEMQVSNWSRRPLKDKQVSYAALDAYSLVKIRDRLWPATLGDEDENMKKVAMDSRVSIQIQSGSLPEWCFCGGTLRSYIKDVILKP